MKKVRYAVVGLGNIAQVAVLPAFAHAKKNSQLVALVSNDAKKIHALKEQYPQVEAHGTYDELESIFTRAKVDAAYVALPNSMHREIVERIAALGVHVLCEKPMALSVEECESMIDATANARVKLMIAYRLHFEEATLRTLELVRSGTIGDPRIVSSTFSHQVRPGDIRTQGDLGGGALYDLGIYCINAARHLFADEPIEVFGYQTSGGDSRAESVDQTTMMILRFPDDRLAQLAVSQGVAAVSSYRIAGTEGSIRVEPAYEYAEGLTQLVTIGEKESKKKFPKRDQFAPELLYFSSCILEDREPEPSGVEGLADVRVMQAVIESARTGAPVKLAPFERSRRPGIDQMIRRPAVEKPETIHAPSPSE